MTYSLLVRRNCLFSAHINKCMPIGKASNLMSQGISQRGGVYRQRITTFGSPLLKLIRLLRRNQLERAYAEAWSEWSLSGDEELWDTTSGDGVE
jgi:hypothetical protein